MILLLHNGQSVKRNKFHPEKIKFFYKPIDTMFCHFCLRQQSRRVQIEAQSEKKS
jgi:hypothetical protein